MKEKFIRYKDVEVHYSDMGEGSCIVLLHGYLEAGPIWGGFAKRLSENFRVLVPDLPGHGRSGTWGEVHSMEDVAGAVKQILEKEDIRKIILVGHSMGGYVCMAFAEAFSERLHGYVLFHSTCFADNEEKKLNREREIGLIKCGRKRQIVMVNISKAFADDNVEGFRREVEKAREIAMECENDGIIALLNGMKLRSDRTRVLEDSSLPLMLIGGGKDNYILPEVFSKLTGLAPHASVLLLEESGHMGFVEEPEKAEKALTEFARALE